MEWAQSDLIGVIEFLLPGFLAAWIFFGLTAHPKQSPFERIVQALIFTGIVQVVTSAVRYSLENVPAEWATWGEWTKQSDQFWSTVNALAIGLLFASLANHDVCHTILRWCQLTKRTSYPSEWFSSFNRSKRLVILHLKSERRLHGFAEEWPDQADSGHFAILSPAWLLDTGELVPLHSTCRFLLPASEVEMVEFMKEPDEITASLAELKAAEDTLVNLQKSKGEDDGKQGAESTGRTTTKLQYATTAGQNGEATQHRIEAGHVTSTTPEEKVEPARNRRNKRRR